MEQSGTILSRDVWFQNYAENLRCSICGGGKHFLVEFSTEHFKKSLFPKLEIKFFYDFLIKIYT